MKLQRISKDSLKKIIDGKLRSDALIVIKLYSEMCPKCKSLASPFSDMAKDYKDVYFMAFNVDDCEDIDKLVRTPINGVPTLLLVKHKIKQREPVPDVTHRVKVMPDPENPHPHHWYHLSDIREFINKNKRRKKNEH